GRGRPGPTRVVNYSIAAMNFPRFHGCQQVLRKRHMDGICSRKEPNGRARYADRDPVGWRRPPARHFHRLALVLLSVRWPGPVRLARSRHARWRLTYTNVVASFVRVPLVS